MFTAHMTSGVLGSDKIATGPHLLNKVKGEGIIVHPYAFNRPHHHPQYLVIYDEFLITDRHGEFHKSCGIVDKVGTRQGTEQAGEC